MEKQLENWKPTCGETYYYISQSGTIASTRAGFGVDTYFKIATKNCYPSYQACKIALEQKLTELGFSYFNWGKLGIAVHTDYSFPSEYYPKYP